VGILRLIPLVLGARKEKQPKIQVVSIRTKRVILKSIGPGSVSWRDARKDGSDENPWRMAYCEDNSGANTPGGRGADHNRQ